MSDPIDEINFFKSGYSPFIGSAYAGKGPLSYSDMNSIMTGGYGGYQSSFFGRYFGNYNNPYANTFFPYNSSGNSFYGDSFHNRSYFIPNVTSQAGYYINNTGIQSNFIQNDYLYKNTEVQQNGSQGGFLFNSSFGGLTQYYKPTLLSQTGVFHDPNSINGYLSNVEGVSENVKGYKYGLTYAGAAKFFNPDGKEITLDEFKKAVGSDFEKFKEAINAECKKLKLKDAIS